MAEFITKEEFLKYKKEEQEWRARLEETLKANGRLWRERLIFISIIVGLIVGLVMILM